jgi:glycosyltransferase involved in cell wall biosynthesis
MVILCFSHLRWNFVYQRPQHLLSRFARHYKVYFIEEPMYDDGNDHLKITVSNNNVHVVVPYLKNDTPDVNQRQAKLLDKLIRDENITGFITWYYSPLAYLFTHHLKASLIVYDCMDELSAFKFASPQLKDAEQRLIKNADIMFTGGYSLYYAKKHLHPNIHPFPSSIEKEHFAKARIIKEDPADQKHIPHPRLGFFGVLDERFDIGLIREAALKKPEWNFILIGPVVKIHPDDLPHNDNIYYLGTKSYAELPAYLSGWDIALVPFAINESTKYISPTKTPEYLAAGKPVISTPIADVVTPYGDENLVSIVRSADDFIEAAKEELGKANRLGWLRKVDKFLAENSWDHTFTEMNARIKNILTTKNYNPLKTEAYV